ncbi:polysaccharide deacetylase family protein [Lacinutrix sp. 5H-3-7-4]|uniref:polysaccharide deacetylase family protein n=1 Tax=Lacinutrix sp. (strain 5H-3-7-4) TaxID=983544 RepID=UPI00020A38AA|nr:polysaccharide deacetylase family protein [Lacinutrix sp. 5H-3-7-4]AEH00887.1 hypothetical protein Lacal_1039 [Lacinutrix sp. 5H-3-7-4]
MNGNFIVSLDYELMWGVRDKKTISNYGENINNVSEIIHELLILFNKYNINATFSTVGFLFAKNKEELINYIPKQLPKYKNDNLSPYKGYIDKIGDDSSDSYHYALKDILKIKDCENHEISTHTFSHYYCLEEGQEYKDFKEDINSAIKIAEKEGIKINTIIFPRNQYNSKYDKILIEVGIKAYRGNENIWFYKEKNGEKDSMLRRMMRLIDTYINISGHNCYNIQSNDNNLLINLPSSRFLRPYNPKLKFLETFRLRRIKKSMTYAAKKGLVYHLWWHPHNFGSYKELNFQMLENILKHYKKLNENYDFQSSTMSSFLKV